MCTLDCAENHAGMPSEPQLDTSILERIDLALAQRIVGMGSEPELLAGAQRFQDRIYRADGRDARWIGALLRLRGLLILDEDVADVLTGHAARFPAGTQEACMIRGLHDLLREMRERGSLGRPPDGRFLTSAFAMMTNGIARFRNNSLRRDAPWDAILYVSYPLPLELEQLLATFDAAHRYRDVPHIFDRLHPVRQSCRILWRLARIAPFPDMNLVMAWVAMCSYLLAKGYPLLRPESQDQGLLTRLIGGPPPLRVTQFEGRLLDAVEWL